MSTRRRKTGRTPTYPAMGKGNSGVGSRRCASADAPERGPFTPSILQPAMLESESLGCRMRSPDSVSVPPCPRGGHYRKCFSVKSGHSKSGARSGLQGRDSFSVPPRPRGGNSRHFFTNTGRSSLQPPACRWVSGHRRVMARHSPRLGINRRRFVWFLLFHLSSFRIAIFSVRASSCLWADEG